MFLDTAIRGLLTALTSPRLWLGAAAYAVAHSLVLTARARASRYGIRRWGERFVEERRPVRYLYYLGFLTSELADLLVLVAVVALLVPAVLGPPALPIDWAPPTAFLHWFAAAFAAMVVLLIWRVIPLLGQLLQLVPPLATYVVAIWTLHILVDATPAATRSGLELPFPGLLPTVGFFAVSLVPWVAAAYLALDWERDDPADALSPASRFVLRLGGSLAGLVPLFMYGAWITRSMGG